VLSGKDIIAVGGTGRGADTALVPKPANNPPVRRGLCFRTALTKGKISLYKYGRYIY
jgi:hypothetical protein